MYELNVDYEDEPNNGDEPSIDYEDIGCRCTEDGVDSEWYWDSDQDCWVCAGCGDVQ